MSTVRTVYFGETGRRCIGALVQPHDRSDVIGRSGVVICDPFGIEALAADRTLNHLVAALVAAGVTVLRFAPPGAGDSVDLCAGESIVGQWQSAIASAIELVSGTLGGAPVAVIGLRLGATLAAAVAAERSDVDRIVLWAPVAGRPFTRELKLLGAAVNNDPTALAVEAGGFGLNQASIDELSPIDIAKLPRRPAPEVLIVDRDDVPGAGKLAVHLRSLDAMVDAPILPGYSAMRLDDPEQGDVPMAAVDAMVSWVARPRAPAARAPDPNPAAELVDRLDLCVDGTAVTETSLRIPVKSGQDLHGILTRPTASSRDSLTSELAIVLLTTGANPCCGPGRLHARLARHWASLGHIVVRVDRQGVGLTELRRMCTVEAGLGPSAPPSKPPSAPPPAPSAPTPGGEPTLSSAYDDVHIEDVASIAHEMRAALAAERVVVIGTCSGAYTIYRSARRGSLGANVVALISINQIIFDDHAWTTEGDSPAYAIKARYELGQALRHPSRWVDVLRGDTPVIPALRRLARFSALKVRVTCTTGFARLLGRAMPAYGVAADMQAIEAHGIRQTYVFDEAETGLGYLRLHADASMVELETSGRMRRHVVSGAGHTFGPEQSKRWLIETLDASLADLVP